MAKQLNVNMSFTADTAQAKAQIADLQHSLQNLSTSTLLNTSNSGFSKSITEATAKVAELRANLEAAINTNTGQLDLSKFSQQLKQSNTTLGQYKTQLMALGPEGTKAFAQLASAIVQAEMPLKQTNALMSELWTTLQNTVRWQLTSSLIHGIMRTISQAFGYVKNLNGALNDIRIRTGASTEQMADFAKYANEAAKSLSTTTLDMAKASLIYYQQGLSDEEAKKRAEITVKMANVTRDSAQEVSQQLTAVWNNFAEGGQNLEYYADVMNALGAATASSTDEIATGLEKFAAVAKTAGLSYEYAASALATIAATTRQSAETVGTGLRTVLARIESLKLGDTLEDGVDLTKYTSALQTIGVEVLDINGNLKSADEILNDMAASWQNLTAEQKMATAETVGGIRQYATIMALMENWDFMKKNIDVARSSEGTLQKQADIYAESWEAAANRVQASVQGIYQQLLDDQFFTKALDGFAKFLDIIKQTIDGIGGLKSLLLIVSTIITTKLQTQLAESFQRIGHNFMMMTNTGRQRLQEMRQEAVDSLTGEIFKGKGVYDTSMSQAYKNLGGLSSEYVANADKMNETQRKIAGIMMDQQKILIENVELTAKEAQEAEKVAKSLQMRTKADYINASPDKSAGLNVFDNMSQQGNIVSRAEYAMSSINQIFDEDDKQSYTQILEIFDRLKITGEELESVYGTEVREAFDNIKNALVNVDEDNNIANITEDLMKLDVILDNSDDYVEQLVEKFSSFATADIRGRINSLTDELNTLNSTENSNKEATEKLKIEISELEEKEQAIINRTRNFINAQKDQVLATQKNQESLNKLNKMTEDYKKKMSQLVTQNYTLSQSFAALASSMSAIGMTVSMVSSAIRTLTNPDTSGLEKLITIFTTIGFIVPNIMRLMSTENVSMIGTLGLKLQGLTAEKVAYDQITTSMTKYLTTQSSISASDAKELSQSVTKAAAYLAESKGIDQLTASELKNFLAEAMSNKEKAAAIGMTPERLSTLVAEAGGIDAVTAAHVKQTTAATTAAAASMAAMWPILAIAAAIAAVVAAIVIFNKVTHQARDHYKSVVDFNKGLKEHTQQVTDEFQNLNNTLDQLHSKADALQDLTYGTSEWRTSVAEVNKEVQELIDKYDLVAGEDWYFDNTGVQRLTAAGEEHIQLKAEDLYISAQKVELAADIAEREAQIAAEKEEILSPNFLQFIAGGKYSYNVGTEENPAYLSGMVNEDQLNAVVQALTSRSIFNEDLANENALLDIDGIDAITAKIISQNEDLQLALIGLSNNIIKLDETTQQQISAVNLLSDENIHKSIFGTTDENGNVVGGVSEKYQTDAVRELGQYGQVIYNGYEQQFANTKVTGADQAEWAESLGYEYSSQGYRAAGEEEWTQFNENTDNAIRKWKAVQAAQEDVSESFDEYIHALEEKSDKFWGIADQLKEKWENLAPSLEKCTEAQADFNETQKQYGKNSKEAFNALERLSKVYSENSEAIGEVRSSLADMYELSEDQAKSILSDEFIVKNAQLIEDAINDDQAAVEELGRAFDIAKTMEFVASLDDSEFNGKKDEILNAIDNLELKDITIGSSIETAPFYDALQEMLYMAGADADTIEAILNSIGFNPEVTYEPVDLDQGTYNKTTGMYDFVDSEGNTHSVTMEAYTAAQSAGVINIPIINGSKTTYNGSPSGNVLSRAGGGAAAPRSGGNSGGGGGGGGGGGSAPKKAKTQKVEKKEPERYKEITDTIEDLTQALEETNTESDRLWGKDRLSSMQKANDILKKQADAYKEKARQARNFLDIDRAALQKTLTATWTGEYENENGDIERVKESFGNLGFTFDADWDISNYTEIMTKITDMYNKRLEYWADPSHFADADAQSRYEDLYVKPMEEQISLIEEAISKYEETKGVWEENEEAAKEAIREWQDNNFEQLELKLDLKLEVNDSELKRIEYYIDKLSDDFYSMGENLANYIDKIDNAEQKMQIYAKAIEDLNAAYKAGEISQDAYYEQLKKIQDEEQNQLKTLKELDDTLKEYFGQALDSGLEEFDKYKQKLENINDGLEHYKDVMSLLGKSTDYKMINSFLDGIAKNTYNNYLASKNYYDMLNRQRASLEKQLDKFAEGTTQRAFIQKQLDDMETALADAESRVFEDAEATAEAFKTLWESVMDEIRQGYEMAVTEGLGFDFLNSSLDRLSSRQDEYLTKTNQIYEMNDLLRKLQADSDKTNNVAAKQRIANFADEMKALKNKSELSKLDLDIAKARYQQLLAQIALEEAQNAKSMVRLHRDNEGNYGYMYTADQDKINEAEANLAKTNNDLYNIVLNATNDYSQKAIKLREDFYSDLEELTKTAHEEGWYETERYEEEVLQLQREYEALSKSYYTEYTTAVSWLNETAATDQTEAWTNSYKSMVEGLQNWGEIAEETINKVKDSLKDYSRNVAPLLEGPNSLATSFGTTDEYIGNAADKSQDLAEALIGENGVVDAIGKELQDVLKETNRYLANHKQRLDEVVRVYEALVDKIARVIELQSIMDGDSLTPPEKSVVQEGKEAADSFASGGYTGSWGGFGKIALLHEKELVLNKEDTENLLMSVDILRRLSSALDLQAMGANISSISAISSINGGNAMQQDVTIHAEFPNAVDHNEIEMAFDSLINRASQYAGRF